MTRIYLVRHGESVANTKSIYQGVTYDTPLSTLGKKQAKALTKRFQNVNVESIIASPLLRTMMTAQPVADAKKIAILQEKSIKETNHGEWEGKHKDVVEKTWPNIYKKWQKFPSSVQFPNGEHFLDTQERVIRWWDELVKNEGKDVLVVSHINIIQVIIARVLNMKLNRIWKFQLQPTSISMVDINNGTATLAYLNDVKHLGELQSNLANHAL